MSNRRIGSLNPIRPISPIGPTPQNSGFTIQELLVVLIIGSLLVGFSFSLFLFVNKMFSSWHRTAEFRQEIHAALQTVALDMQKSQRLVELSDTLCVIEKPTGVLVTYRFGGVGIWRNGIPVTPDTTIHCALSMNKVPYAGGGGTMFRIEIRGTRKTMEYSAGADILLAKSSLQQFGGM